ncbi:hypothetical protein I634_12660 [Alteromonas mediterranea U8]|nr:hypothetical protein I634_12660 [Alteromonas mediterranea U8]
MKQIKKSSVATALGAVVIGSLASTVAVADANPFGMQALESGYSQFAAEGKCGGEKRKEGSAAKANVAATRKPIKKVSVAKANVAAIRKLAKKVSVAKVNAVACNRHSNNIVQREIE